MIPLKIFFSILLCFLVFFFEHDYLYAATVNQTNTAGNISKTNSLVHTTITSNTQDKLLLHN